MSYFLRFYALDFILQLQILTVETAIDFGCSLGWEKRTFFFLWTVTEVFQLKIHLVEVQLCFFFVWEYIHSL